jgi:hypothetical protein
MLFVLGVLLIALLAVGCASKFSSFLTESWSENYALAVYDTKASHIEINDGDKKTWGVTRPPDRVYTITFPEEKEIDRIVVYSGNVIAYRLFCWDKEMSRWELAGALGSTKGRQKAHSDRHQLEIPQFAHRINIDFKTDKIRLQVTRAESDGIAMTRTPGKNDRILNQKVEFVDTNRGRMRIDLYEVFVEGEAMIREIEAYSHMEKPESE